jgi:type I restriction-modification system DNA methylase subunit
MKNSHNKKNLRAFINLLKSEIIKTNTPEIQIKDDKLIYSLKKYTEYNISSYSQTVLGELGRAYAILSLIKKYKISPDNILHEEASIIGAPSKRLDIKINIEDVYNGRKCIALIECKTSLRKISDIEFTDYFKRQLYNMAHPYAKDLTEPYPLILIAAEILYEKRQIKLSYYWFHYPDIEKAIETGQVSIEEIISRNSPFAHSQLPPERLYFSNEIKILKSKDLIEIKDPNEFKNLLKEKLHQGLRNYGIVEERAFNTLINLLLAKVYDEICSVANPNRDLEFQVKPLDYLYSSDFYNRIKKLFENALIQLLGEDPKTAKRKEILEHRDKEKILLEIIPYLQRIKLRSLRFFGEDSMGDVFLDFMHSIFRQSRGLFFTHPNICRFVCKAVNIERIKEDLKRGNYKYILDPSCGSGTFLIEALRLIFKEYPIEKIRENALKILFGLDNNPVATALCKVNMVLHGDGSANVYTRDALSPLSNLPFSNIKPDSIQRFNKGCVKEMLKDGFGFDIIITNPPFSIEIKKENCLNYCMSNFIPFKNNTTTSSECIFAERWFQLLNSDGRIGVVLPFSLFDSPQYLKARLLFLCYFKIIAIVGLPEHAFAPHAQQRTVLVFAKKRSLNISNRLFENINNPLQFIEPIKNERIIFYDAENIGYVRKKVKKTVITQATSENDLSDDVANIIASAFEGNMRIKNKKIEILTLEELLTKRNLNLTPVSLSFQFLSYRKHTFTLQPDWEVVEVEKSKHIYLKRNLFICETGDIVTGGSGIITPKNLSLTTVSNRERIFKKIKLGKFGYLKEGDVIIAPVRVYQKKIAVVTKTATNFLFSKDFIVLRKKKNANLRDSFTLFYLLIKDENIHILTRLSSVGKSGYPKIKNKEKILKVEFYKFNVPSEKLKRMACLYDKIYKEIFCTKEG